MGDNLTPLSMLLVKDGSRGDKLLFKYPYCFELPSPINSNKDTSHSNAASGERRSKVSSIAAYLDPDMDPFLASERPASCIKDGFFTGISDKGLSNLLAVKTDMCNSKFELQINDVQIIGHPLVMNASNKKNSIQMFHLAIVLRAETTKVVLDGYYNMLQRLSVGLKYMDVNNLYLTKQLDAMLSVHEEESSVTDGQRCDPYDTILFSNDLAISLVNIYSRVGESGEYNVNLDNWFNSSFVLPQRVYLNLPVGRYLDFHLMNCRKKQVLRYMSIMLLRERSAFLAHRHPLVTPTIRRSCDITKAPAQVMDVCSVNSTLGKIANDADVTYGHLVDIVAHFVHRGLMLLIYPVCNSNRYVTSSKALQIMSGHRLTKRYSHRFPHSSYSLQQLLEQFSSPVSPATLTERCTSQEQRYDKYYMILWLMEYGLIYQVHKFVYISVPVHCGVMNIRSMKNILSQSQARAGEGAKKNVSEPTEFCMEEKDPLNKESNPVLPRTRQRRVGLMHYTEEEPEEKQEKETFVCNSCSSKVVCGWCENCGDVSYDSDSADDAAEAQSGSAISTPSPIDTDEPSDQNSPHGTRDGSKALSGVLRNATDVRGKKKKKVSWCKGQADYLRRQSSDGSLNDQPIALDGHHRIIRTSPVIAAPKAASDGVSPDKSSSALTAALSGDTSSGDDNTSSSDTNSSNIATVPAANINVDQETGESCDSSIENRNISSEPCPAEPSASPSKSHKHSDSAPDAASEGEEFTTDEERETSQLLMAANLTLLERCAVLTLFEHYAETITQDDLRTFLHLTDYFRGFHHLEEIMYTTNLSRGRILSLLDKFSLMLCVVEGPAKNYPINVC